MSAEQPPPSASPALARLRFTVSVSPAHMRGGIDLLGAERVVARLRALAPHIHDLNFTCRVPPFLRDAHGVHLTPEENHAHFEQLLAAQRATGITASAVFNDILVPNTEEELRRFVTNLEPLVARGLRSISVPHVLWMKMGLLRKAFPGLFIKDTVLREVRSGQDLWNHAEAGYDYVNVDRRVLRDRAALVEIAAARDAFAARCGKRVVLSVLHGEGCLGACPLVAEHYHHTLTHPRVDDDLPASLEVFRLPTRYACQAIGHPNVNLPRLVGLPWFREELEEISAFFDVIKLAGRRSFLSLGDALDGIEGFLATGGELVYGAPPDIARLWRNPASHDLVLRWRKATRTCRYQCWRCSICTELGTFLG